MTLDLILLIIKLKNNKVFLQNYFSKLLDLFKKEISKNFSE